MGLDRSGHTQVDHSGNLLVTVEAALHVPTAASGLASAP